MFDKIKNSIKNHIVATSEPDLQGSAPEGYASVNPVNGDKAAQAAEISASENDKTSEVLTPEDVKELEPLYTKVIMALKQVFDPEIPVNIYDLGLIYELNINKEHNVYIQMTFTAPNCPMADEVLADVQHSVEEVPGINKVELDLVFDPAWDKSMLSEEARLELGLD